MKFNSLFTFLSISFLSIFLINTAFAQNFPAKSNRLVNDYTGTLSNQQVEALEQKLVAFDDSTSSQIAVVLIKSLGDYDIADYAVRLAQQWGIGGKQHDNGILLLASIGDRKVTIQTGYGLEGAVPDAIAYRIINSDIKPAFARQDYYKGLDQATNSLIDYTKGEYKAKPKKQGDEGGIPIGLIIIVFVILFALISKGGGGKGGGQVVGSRGSSDLLWWTLLGGLAGGRGGGGGFGGGHRGGGFGGGGGGFGGFGGGGFGGGGSSGSW